MSSTPEVEWDDTERAWMFALAEYEAGKCPGGCGGQLHETADDTVDWTGTPPVRCNKCTEIARSQAEFLYVDPNADPESLPPEIKFPHALYWGARRI